MRARKYKSPWPLWLLRASICYIVNTAGTACPIYLVRQSFRAYVRWKRFRKGAVAGAVVVFLTFSGLHSFAQEKKPVSLDSCINIALKNNPDVRVASLEIEQDKALQRQR